MRTTILFLAAPAASLVAVVLVLPRLRAPSVPITVQSQGPTIERLERLNQLVTTRVSVADVLVGEGEGCRGVWLIRGDALIAVDLGQARITARREDAKQATILLPEPEVLQPRVDHQRTRTWEVRRLAWLPWNADQDRLRDTVMAQAQQLVVQAAGSAENIQQAKIAAETILKTLYAEVGWSITVQWAPPRRTDLTVPRGSSVHQVCAAAALRRGR